jgi:hypothetical protein
MKYTGNSNVLPGLIFYSIAEMLIFDIKARLGSWRHKGTDGDSWVYSYLWIVLLTSNLLNINYLHGAVMGARGVIKSCIMFLLSKVIKSCLEAKHLCIERLIL